MKGDERIELGEKGTHEIRLLATWDGHLKALYKEIARFACVPVVSGLPFGIRISLVQS